jgi:hypothetical protein
MKIKLNEAIKSYDNFLAVKENNTDVINTQVETTLDAEVAVADDTKIDMMSDVDHIITSLETLAGQVQEEIELFKSELLNEEVINESLPMPIQWMKGKILSSKQKKINIMKLKSSDMSTAAAALQGTENKDKKSYLIDKKKQLDGNVIDLQKMVDSRAKEIGSTAEKVINRVKIAGQIEVIKSQIGNVDDAKKASTMKARLGDLIAKGKEEDEALADLKAKADKETPESGDPIQAIKDAISKAKDTKKSVLADRDMKDPVNKLKQVELDIKIKELEETLYVEDGDNTTNPKDKADEIVKLKEMQVKLTKEIEDAKGEPKEGEPKEGEPKEGEPKEGEPKEGEPKEGEPKVLDKNTKEGKLKRLEDAMANAIKVGDQGKIAKIQSLIDRISAKESWQINGTELGRLLEMEITKIESEYILNESKYAINSIKEAFARLI